MRIQCYLVPEAKQLLYQHKNNALYTAILFGWHGDKRVYNDCYFQLRCVILKWRFLFLTGRWV